MNRRFTDFYKSLKELRSYIYPPPSALSPPGFYKNDLHHVFILENIDGSIQQRPEILLLF